MVTPSKDELSMIAQFKVGEVVWTRSSGPWKVIGRWWLKEKQCIGYDLQFKNGTVLQKVVEYEVYATQQAVGTHASIARRS